MTMRNRLRLEENQAFHCTSCGLCCTRRWGVYVDASVRPGIEASQTYAARAREGYLPLEMNEDGRVAVARKSNGECTFLDEDALCGVHRELGSLAKPMGCQMFPYSATRTPTGTFFSQSFACPPVVAGLDRDVEANRMELSAVLERFPEAAADLPDYEYPVRLSEGRTISWTSYLDLEKRLGEAYDASRPLDSLLAMALNVLATTAGDTLLEEWPALGAIPADLSFERELFTMYLSSIIAVVETEDDIPARAGFTTALLAGESLISGYFEMELPPLDLDRPQTALLHDTFERYVRNGLVGKTLLQPTVVARLLAMAIAFAAVSFYGEAYRCKRGDDVLTLEALTLAFEVIESDVASHSRVLEPFFLDLEETFKKLVS